MTAETTLHLGERRVDGVVFVSEQRPRPPSYRKHDTRRGDIVHVSTDDLTRTPHIREALLAQIRQAKCKVFFCSFLFADEEIVAALCEAAERLQGGVYVLTSLDKHLRPEVLELDAEIDLTLAKLRERVQRHEGHLRRLANAGVWLRSAEDCHAKLCVVDDEFATVTSANATPEAYESNPEDGLVLRDPRVSRELGRLFAHVWQYLATQESTPGVQLDVHTLPSVSPAMWTALSSVPGIRPVATLRTQEASVLEAIVSVIEGAKDHLVIATYCFIGMENHPVGQALARALARNVRIDVLVQPRNTSVAQRASLQWLLQLGPDRVRLYGHRRTHTKSIVADGETVVLWTGNLDARHGWESGIEVGVVVEDPAVAAAVAGWTADVMDRSTHRALSMPIARDLVIAGEQSALGGQWTLRLPADVRVGSTVASLSKNAVELLETHRGYVLRCGQDLLLDVNVDEAKRELSVLRVSEDRGLPSNIRSKGWLVESTLRIVSARPNNPSQVRTSSRQQPRQASNGRRGRR